MIKTRQEESYKLITRINSPVVLITIKSLLLSKKNLLFSFTVDISL